MRRLLLVLVCCMSIAAKASEIRVAVAANFAPVLKALAPDFEQKSGYRLLVSAGATGRFYAQITHGGAFDVFLGADAESANRLHAQGLAGKPLTYAIGRLALWSPQIGKVDPDGRVLSTGQIPRLAIANPKTAPYGLAAQQALERMGLLSHYRNRMVFGESIGQTYQFVASGAVDFGLLALSQVWRDGRLESGSVWIVPANLHAPLTQNAVVLMRSTVSRPAQDFLDYLRSPEVRSRIQSFGYELPKE